MRATKKWGGRATTAAVLTAAGMLLLGGVAHADNIQDTIADTGTGVTLVAGSSTSGSAAIRVVGNNSAGDPDPGCNIDAGESPLVLDLVTPAGVTANPDPLNITSCGADFSVTFTASSSAVSGEVTVTVQSGPAGDGTYINQVHIPITVIPSNTKPSVAVQGVTAGTSYEIGAVPDATCAVSDAEDGSSTVAAVITGTLSHGLGSQTATCDYTDEGGLAADTASATYTIVDTGNPTISHTLTPSDGPNANGWYNQDVAFSFTCGDSGSGVESCVGDTTLGEGANQSVTGTATDWAGNTATDLVSGINIDETDPTVSFSGGPVAGSSYYFGSVPEKPTCQAFDGLSGAPSCEVTGGGTTTGEHTYTATAIDNAGNEGTATLTYTVTPWRLTGFYAPVDLGVWNTVKGGSTVPLKFEAFAGSELTSTSAVKSFTQKQVTCSSGAGSDDIEITTTGGTALRYDATAGQFIQNWATPKRPGTCWTVTMTTQDGSPLSANFLLK